MVFKCLTLAVLLVFSVFNFAKAEGLVYGLVELNELGIGIVTECSSGNKYQFGVMASNPYFEFAKRYFELSKSGTVIVKVKGDVKAGVPARINSPTILVIKNGRCGSEGG